MTRLTVCARHAGLSTMAHGTRPIIMIYFLDVMPSACVRVGVSVHFSVLGLFVFPSEAISSTFQRHHFNRNASVLGRALLDCETNRLSCLPPAAQYAPNLNEESFCQ